MDQHHNCAVEPLEKSVDMMALAASTVAYLAVQGMGCSRCAMRVHNGLLRLDGTLAVDVFLEYGLAAVAYNPEQIKPAALLRAVFNAGNDGRHHYQATLVAEKPASEALAL
ncbi:MAG: heavy-metal-associated domain-containing protein [Anaerolineae bacterium]|nr:heavy-metal-associated domain-containing protein [Anaerolineae bacterium]